MVKSVRGVCAAIILVLAAFVLWMLIDPAPPDAGRGDRSAKRSATVPELAVGRSMTGGQEDEETVTVESYRLDGTVHISDDGEKRLAPGA